MKLLVIGGGAREHALIWKLQQSPRVEKIWCTPGNGGISDDAECIPADLTSVSRLADLAAERVVDLTIVGPELPLAFGVADEFRKRGMRIIGPSKAGAELESSKVTAKQFMQRHGIPTAAVHKICNSPAEAYAAVSQSSGPIVIKADGLCAGKGVLVATSQSEASDFLDRVMESDEFGEAGKSVLLEEALEGEELSYIVLTDGRAWWPLVPTRDHKKLIDGDQGPNTGGMGAYSEDGLLSSRLEKQIVETIVTPTIEGLAKEKRPYCGFLYFGLMLTRQGPRVLEYNCRLGDPETEAIVLRMNFDLLDALDACADGQLKSFQQTWKPGASVCVVLASEGYPTEPKLGRRISGLESARRLGDVCVFHAGTKREGRDYYTTGGRVLTVAAAGETMDSATESVYNAIAEIQFDGCQYRRDIGRAIRLPRVGGLG